MSVLPRRVGVIGCPVSHSLSPLIHNYWLQQHNIDARYDAVEILPGRLKDGIEKMLDDGYGGWNVTIPHKQDMMALCDELDETAQKIGAVNTVTLTPQGKLRGANTDSFGFAENIRAAGVAIPRGYALVLGAGGAARAVVHGLQALGFKRIVIANRTRSKAEEIAGVFPVEIIDWADRAAAAKESALLVNTTALGMTGQGPLDFDLSLLPRSAVVCDIVYKPLYTDLLKSAQARGNPVVTGIGMLLHQARPAFAAWFGVMPDIDDALQKVVDCALFPTAPAL